MNLDRILGQHDIKEKIYNSITNKSFPQSKILVDRDGYGGLNLAIEIAKSLLKNDSSFFRAHLLLILFIANLRTI